MKNTKKTLSVILVLIVAGMLLGCSTVSKVTTTQGYANTLEEAHPDRLEKTVIGMDVNEFKSVWPEATRSGISQEGEIYEFVYARIQERNIYGIAAAYYKIYTYFHFTNSKLVKYESQQKVF